MHFDAGYTHHQRQMASDTVVKKPQQLTFRSPLLDELKVGDVIRDLASEYNIGQTEAKHVPRFASSIKVADC